jgi:16S rRNA (cytosine1402-N4)-methyltransferase
MHKTVLLEEAVELLNLKPGMIVVDATLGAGGHSELIMKKIGKKGILIGIDLDQTALDEFKENIDRKFNLSVGEKNKPEIKLIKGNFKDIELILKKIKIKKVDAVVADLGWRLDQIKNEKYGMSFQVEAPLDMRLGGEGKRTAYNIINSWKEQSLVEIFFKYGEEASARKIAKRIIEKRKEKKIETTKELEAIIIGNSKRKSGINPATKVFQALRITVNDELNNLEVFLKKSIGVLNNKGRLAVISFHSLEDRMVKKFFRANTGGCICPKEIPVCVCNQKKKLEIITKKPVRPSEEELKKNPRSRSAKLRVAERVRDIKI